MRDTLAARLIACPRFRWLDGMRISSPPELAGLRVTTGSVVSPAALPDLDDPATVGCLRALVREVRREPHGFVLPPGALTDGWAWCRSAARSPPEPMLFEGDTEAAALVVALEWM